MKEYVVKIVDYATDKVKKYDLGKYDTREDFLEAYRKDGMDDGEIVDTYVDAFVDLTFPVEDCWDYMLLDEYEQDLVDIIVSNNWTLNEALYKVKAGEYEVYDCGHIDLHLEDAEVVGLSLLNDIGVDELLEIAVKDLNLEEQIAELVGQSIINGSSSVIRDEDSDNTVIVL